MARYVKFMQGSPKAYKALAKKDGDTLYFIHEQGALDGALYLGSKLIAGEDNLSSSSIDALADVLISENIEINSILAYDEQEKKWVNKNIFDIFQPFVGATELSSGVAGLVPAPVKGKTNLFLRSDGTWAIPPAGGDGNGYITSTTEDFEVSETGQLSLNKINISQVVGLEEALKTKNEWIKF